MPRDKLRLTAFKIPPIENHEDSDEEEKMGELPIGFYLTRMPFPRFQGNLQPQFWPSLARAFSSL